MEAELDFYVKEIFNYSDIALRSDKALPMLRIYQDQQFFLHIALSSQEPH